MATRHIRGGFSLAEVLFAIAILAMASSALLLITEVSADSTRFALERSVAEGIASQVVDEVLGRSYMEKGGSAFAWPLQAEAGETTDPVRRVLFDDTDDFNGYRANPIADPWAIPLGTGDDAGALRPAALALPDDYFRDWELQIDVRYVDESDPSRDLAEGVTSGLRAVVVTVVRQSGVGWETLAQVRRVFGYVPSTS